LHVYQPFGYGSLVPIDLRISLQKLEVFETAVVTRGVTAAADRLGISQPVVSAHIRSLERRIGTTLFYREGRRLHLTEAGRVVYTWADDLLRRTRELSRDLDSVSDGLAGSVVVGASMSVGSYRIAPLIRDFLATHPAVDIRIDVLPAGRAIEDTASGENDFSLVAIEPPEPTHVLTTELIGTERLVLVAPPDGPPAGTKISVGDLTSLDFVEAQEGSLRRMFIDRELGTFGIHDRRVIVEFGHPEAMKQMVASGVGVCWLFESAVTDELLNRTLKEVTVEGVEIVGPIYFVRRTDKFLSAVHRDLVEALKCHMGK
jgi:DNA-binding transcriptional LysR family regulator